MVTGEVPFDNSNPLDCWMRKIRNEFPSPKELNPDVSDRVDWAVRRAMSAEPGQRPTSCREFMEDLTGQSRVTGPATVRAAAGDVWYLVYKDETGQTHTVKGGTDAIRKALAEGLLGDAAAILVGRSKTGQFQPVLAVAEFRDLIVAPAPVSGRGQAVRASGGYAKISGSVRRPAEKAAVEFDAEPSGRRPVPASGRYAARPPSPHQVVLPPTDDAADAQPATKPKSTSVPAPAKRPQPSARNPVVSEEKPGFDWTPIVMFVVALATAAGAYLVLTR
jgi:hypothetical protein